MHGPGQGRGASYSTERDRQGLQNPSESLRTELPVPGRERPHVPLTRDEPGLVGGNLSGPKPELRVASQEKRGALGEQRETQGSEGTPRDLTPGGNLHPSALDDIDSILEELEDKGSGSSLNQI